MSAPEAVTSPPDQKARLELRGVRRAGGPGPVVAGLPQRRAGRSKWLRRRIHRRHCLRSAPPSRGEGGLLRRTDLWPVVDGGLAAVRGIGGPHPTTSLSWQVVAYAVLSLTIIRMVPVALCLLGSRMDWPTVAFVGWFDPVDSPRWCSR